MMRVPARPLRLGDRVAYSARFLRDTGQQATAADVGAWRGTVAAFDPIGPNSPRFVFVQWDHGAAGRPGVVLEPNLARVGTADMSIN